MLFSALPTIGVETAVTVPINGYDILYGSSLSLNTSLSSNLPLEPIFSVDLGSIRGDHDYSVRIFGFGPGLLTRISKVKFGLQGVLTRIERKFGEGGDNGIGFGIRGILAVYPIELGDFAGFVRLRVTTYPGKISNLLVTSAGIGIEYSGF